MTLHQERSPNPSLHCSIALKAVVLMEQSLEVFLVPFLHNPLAIATPGESAQKSANVTATPSESAIAANATTIAPATQTVVLIPI